MKNLLIALSFAASTGLAFADTPPTFDAEDLPLKVEGLEDLDEAEIEAMMSSVNPLENDLRGLEVAIRMHEGFVIKPDGAFFMLGLTDGAGDIQLDEEFTLIETQGVTSPTLSEAARDAFFIRTYELDPADHDRIRAADMLLQEIKRTSTGDNQLTFNAGAKTCASNDTAAPEEYRIAIFVRTAPDVDFIPLSAGDVVMTKENAGPLSEMWSPCGA
ncbi:MAG: hypothetical protein AAFR51_11600 [Pseudomonadota bacterium]